MPSNSSALSHSTKAGKAIRTSRTSSIPAGTRALPKLMTMNAIGCLDTPSVTMTTARAHLPNTLAPTRPTYNVTVQRLGMQTPLPGWAHEYMRNRGSAGTRYSRMCIPELHRPAKERLAVQCVGDEVVGAVMSVKLGHEEGRRPLDSDFSPERLEEVQLQVAERIIERYPKKQGLLKQAVYTNLTFVLIRTVLGDDSVETKPKPENGLFKRRGRPVLPILDIDAARAYASTNITTDSPPESPGPVTPGDEPTRTTRVRKDYVASSRWSKSISYTAYSKRTIARWSHRT